MICGPRGKLFNGAYAEATLGIGGENAVAGVGQNLRDKVVLDVAVAYSFFFDAALGGREQVAPYLGEDFMQYGVLGLGERRAGVALDTALAKAFFEVAAKESFYKIERYESLVFSYLKHCVVKYKVEGMSDNFFTSRRLVFPGPSQAGGLCSKEGDGDEAVGTVARGGGYILL